MAEVVDLALSDDDGGTVEEVDLSDEVRIGKSPAQPVVAAAGAQTGRAGRRRISGDSASIAGETSSGVVGRGVAPRASPKGGAKRNKAANVAAATAAAAAARNAVLIDDGPDGDGGGARNTCAACAREVRHPFTLERCGHRLCPACVPTNASTPTPLCPAAACEQPVAVRDLALVLEENAWAELQTKRVAAFRARVQKGWHCPTCQVWVEASSSSSSAGGDILEVGGGRGGTARQRAERLLSGPPLVCYQGHPLCQFCGAALKKTAPSCGCSGSKLSAVSGLLSLLGELVANPASVELCGPVGPLPKPVAAAAGGGRGGRGGRGRGRGSSGHMGGRGMGGRGGGRGGGGWNVFLNGLNGFGGYLGYGQGAGGQKISSKWSKGTGYGGSGDAAAAAAAQAIAAEAESRADKAMVVVFEALAKCLPGRGDFPEHLPELLALVRESPLLQLVCAYLRNDSLMDIAKRRELYQSLFKLVLGFALHELLAPLIDHVPPNSGVGCGDTKPQQDTYSGEGGGGGGGGGGKGKGKSRASSPVAGGRNMAGAAGGDAGGSSCSGVAKDDDELAVVGVTGGGEDEDEDKGEGDEDDDVSVADLLASANRQAKVFAQAPGAGDGKGGAAATLAFALQVTEVYDKVKASLTYLRGIAEARASSPAVVALTAAMGKGGVAGAGLGRKRKREAADIVEVSLESRYLADLGDSRFELVPGLGSSHHFSAQAKQKSRAGGRARAVRISQEVSTLATSLPVQPDSSIFLRVDEDRFDVMRALITGPKGTPYEGGCFEFDILLPPDYPNKPPHVHFITTGGGRVRFNPNLYNSGKVCLSLLGTWSGPGWNSKTSTLLQVLISIQSLIFVAEPYFNEPGFEGQLGTSQGRAASSSYNSRIRNGTLLFGIAEALEKRTGAMAHVKRTHFRLMKAHIMRTARSWLEDLTARDAGGGANPHYGGGVQGAGCGGDFTSMAKVVAKIEKLLTKV